MLYIFSGLPGVGKSHLAMFLAQSIGATYIRADSIEQAMRNEGISEIDGKGYQVAYSVAADNLRLGHSVVADSVNPWQLTREAWRQVARSTATDYRDIEVICSSISEHRHRVENRVSLVPRLVLPTWKDVQNRDYQSWQMQRIQIDTSGRSVSQSQSDLLVLLKAENILE